MLDPSGMWYNNMAAAKHRAAAAGAPSAPRGFPFFVRRLFASLSESGMLMPSRPLPPVSSFSLKMAAIVGMTLCHVGVIFQAALPFWVYCACEAFGGLTFPIMAFLVSEGYRHTHNVRRYAGRLFAFAVVSQVPYGLFFEPVVLDLGETSFQLPCTGNVLFTLLLGLAMLVACDRMKCRPAFWALFAAGTVATVVLDWGVLGPVMILMAHVLPEPDRRTYPTLLAVLALGLPALGGVLQGDLASLPELLYELVGGVGALCLLRAYDGSRGRSLKWFFYLYYPVHILVLGCIAAIVL